MKKQRKKIICGIIAAVCAAALMAGCSDKNPEVGETTAQADSTGTSAPDSYEDMTATTRPLEEGDDYAINKITNKTDGEELPGGFKLMDSSEEYQGKLYVNGSSRVLIRSANYVEDFPEDLGTWADRSCAEIVVTNIMSADTKFGDPVNTTVCGFNAVMYDYDATPFKFEENPDNPDGDPLKVPTGHYKGRNYYFYSEQDVYAVMFDTTEENWEAELPNFEKFIADLQVTKTEY